MEGIRKAELREVAVRRQKDKANANDESRFLPKTITPRAQLSTAFV
jgi:hypothetical protein